jgi:hypothetical protein
MRLGAKQELFAELFIEHCMWLITNGYKIRFGDIWAREGHKMNSNHYIKLAGDLNLFRDGRFLTKTSEHEESGRMWESRHDLCRWGGNWDKDAWSEEAGENDGNHYSLIHDGRM